MKESPFISVIMASYLSPYQFQWIKSASNPEEKFVRSVNSFISQIYPHKELIIVSDGCQKTHDLYYSHGFSTNKDIKLIEIPKTEGNYSGLVRQTGIENSEGNVVCYLDHDDIIGNLHLQIIAENYDYNEYKWCFWDDYTFDGQVLLKRNTELKEGYIGTSCFAHRKNTEFVWSDGYCHDFHSIAKYLIGKPTEKIQTPQYYVCHTPNIDF